MKVLIFITILVALSNAQSQSQYLDDQAFEELVKELSGQNNMGRTELIYFFRVREEKRKANVNYFTGVFRKFLLSLDVRGDVYNWNNKNVVVVTRFQIDTNLILDHMSDWFDKAGARKTSDFAKDDL